MMSITIALLVCLVGAIVHLLSTRGATLGAYAFAVGLWWTLASVAHDSVHWLR